MENEKTLMALLSRLEKLNRIIIIKDFVGFLSWNTSLGGILVPHVGHHCAFCTAMKQNEQAYACCVTCSKVHQWLCQRKGEPFIRDCQFGLSEYSVPILLDDICIGSLSVGMYCQDTQESDERIEALARKWGMRAEELIAFRQQSVCAAAPTEDEKAVFDIVAFILADLFRPYASMAKERAESPTETAFENIMSYLYNHYTDSSLTVAQIAAACNYSESHISHVFSQRMHMNLRTYIKQLRINVAKGMLKHGCSVSTAAYASGFNDANYFCTVFHAMVGMSPSRFARHAWPNPADRQPGGPQ